MSKESYARGFVKASSDAGVDPTALAKIAQNMSSPLEGEARSEMLKEKPRTNGGVTKLSPKLIRMLERLQKAKGRRLKGFDSLTGFKWDGINDGTVQEGTQYTLAGPKVKSKTPYSQKTAADGLEEKPGDDNDDAGIGSVSDNFGPMWRREPIGGKNDQIITDHGSPHPGSYIEALKRSGHRKLVAHRGDFLVGTDGQDLSIRKGKLNNVRNSMARSLAATIFQDGSAPMEALRKSLVRAGERNYKAYLEQGHVPKREVIDRTGIENLKFPNLLEREGPATQKRVKEKFGIENMDDWIKLIQNSMVQVRGRGRTTSMA